MLKSIFIFVFVLSVANCQFYYNYEEERPEEPETQSYDSSEFRYNPPSTVNQQFAQAPRNEPSSDAGQRRTHIRVRSRNYNSDSGSNDPQLENAPSSEPSAEQRTARLQRRQARRRQRQENYVVPTLPPRVYSPSVFENIGLGEAPNGVYIPQDSFLNALRNPSRRAQSSSLVTQPIIQPSITYVNSEPQQRFFVQPPSNDEPRQTSFILPVTRPEVEYVAPAPINAPQNVQARAVGSTRRTRPSVRLQPEYAAPPTVDIDSLREYTDDVSRENVMSQVQYVNPKPRPPQRRRKVTTYRETTLAPRVYSPSVFEKVALGEAPRGIYIPEDSLLNVLRNPSEQQTPRGSYRQETRQLSPQPSTYTPEEYVEEIIEEDPYEVPPPSRRAPAQRSRQKQISRRLQRQGHQREVQPAVQVVQSSSQPRTQPKIDEYEDFERQRPPVQHRTQSQRRSSASAPVRRSQTRSSSPDREESSFRKAKLAIAELPLDTDDDGIPGEAGVNYPTLHVIPKTAFSCSQQPHNGYYADLETSCQVVHLCQSGGVQNSFLCPNGTIFSQEKFSCQWWYKVNCSDAPKFYVKNDELYKVPEKKERKRN